MIIHYIIIYYFKYILIYIIYKIKLLRNIKDLKGRSRGLIEVISRKLPEQTEENNGRFQVRIAVAPKELRT